MTTHQLFLSKDSSLNHLNTTQHNTQPCLFLLSSSSVGHKTKQPLCFLVFSQEKKKKKGSALDKKIIYFSLFVESLLFHNNNWGNCWEFPVFSHPPCWPSILVSKKIAIRNRQQFFFLWKFDFHRASHCCSGPILKNFLVGNDPQLLSDLWREIKLSPKFFLPGFFDLFWFW